jgi:hypothetical protein
MGNGTQGGAVPSCANKYIMNDLARDEWGFDGCESSNVPTCVRVVIIHASTHS